MPGRRWTDKEIQILQDYYPKTTPKEIMGLLPNRSYWSVNIKASRLNIKKLSETLSRVRAVFTGRHHTEETKKKLRQAQLGIPQPQEFCQRLRETMIGEGNPFYGRHHSQETRAAISERHKGKRHSPSTEFTSERMKEVCNRPEERKRRSIRTKQLWQSKEYAEKTLSAIVKALARRPNKLELKVIKLLDENFPNEWEYTGAGKVILGKLIPDFININGQKKIIEVFGEYWHSEKAIKGRPSRTEKGRIREYKKLGYGCLVLWEKDIADEQKVISLVKNFMEVQ